MFPDWQLIKVEGQTNNRWHTVGIKDDRGEFIGIGRARKRIDADQMASKNALIHFGVDVMSDSESDSDDESDDE